MPKSTHRVGHIPNSLCICPIAVVSKPLFGTGRKNRFTGFCIFTRFRIATDKNRNFYFVILWGSVLNWLFGAELFECSPCPLVRFVGYTLLLFNKRDVQTLFQKNIQQMIDTYIYSYIFNCLFGAVGSA